MATRLVLAELSAAYERRSSDSVRIESVGGVDAAKRVHSGESFDVVFLASDAIDKLVAGGSVLADSKVDLVRSPVAVAVGAGMPRPDISSEEALRGAVLAARSIGYSTGPSGVALIRLFEQWGITAQLRGRVMQAPAGVPVGAMVAKGEVALGFQQLSELMPIEGVDVLGTLPDPVQIVTVFSGAVCAASHQPESVRAMLDFMASPEMADVKRRHGMEPA